jgi:hypothetical protein
MNSTLVSTSVQDPEEVLTSQINDLGFSKKVTFDILKYLEREFGRFDISKKPFQIPKRIFKTLEQVSTSRTNYSGSREGDSMS